MKRALGKKILTIAALIAILAQSFSPYVVSIQKTYAQEETPTVTESPTPTPPDNQTPTVTQSPTQTPDQNLTPSDTITPTPTDTPTPDVTAEPTPTPTVDETVTEPSTPTDNLSPPADNSNNQNSSNDNQSQVQGDSTSVTPTPEATVSPTPVIEQPTGNEEINLVILKNISAPAIDLSATVSEGSAVLTTDKPDYAPTDTALITGTNLLPNTTYSLTISSTDNPPTSTTVSVASDDKGVFAYAYQLDGNYRPNYQAELRDASGTVVATTTFTDTTYSVDTYGNSSHSTLKDSFYQGDTVYGKGTTSSSTYLRLQYKNPSNSIVDYCTSSSSVSSLTCDYSLPSNAPTGTWTLNLQSCSSSCSYDYNWTDRTSANFTVSQPSGTITIVKDAQPNSSQSFDFTGSLGNFSLVDDGTSSNTKSFTKDPGNYTVTENSTSHWDLDSVTCVGGSDTNTNKRNAVINLKAGENVTCTFVNKAEPGSIEGYKWNDLNGNGNKDEKDCHWNWGHEDCEGTDEPTLSGWTINLENIGGTILQTDKTDNNGNYDFDNVSPGTYLVCEVQQPGWTMTYPNQGNDNLCKTVTVGAGDDIDNIDFGNHQVPAGTLTIHKVDQGGSPMAGVWVQVSGPSNPASKQTDTSGNATFSNINTGGPYTINVTEPTNYHFASVDSPCTGTDPTRLSLATLTTNGATCTVHDTIDNGTLTVKKHVVGGTATASDWTMHISNGSQEVTSFAGNEGGVNVGLIPGSYTVTETGTPIGYTLSYSGDCDSNGNVSVSVNTTKICTLTNTRDTGTITVDKVTNPPGDQTKFSIDLTQGESLIHSSVLSDQDNPDTYTVPTGVYSLSEEATTGWDLTSAVCTSNLERSITPSELSLNSGEHITCVFTNTISIPVLTISKFNDAAGNKAPGDSVGFTITITATQSAAQGVTVTDLLPKGFAFDPSSWKVVSSIHGDITGSLSAPVYHSPGTWNLGNMAIGETFTLTYNANIDTSEQAGTYYDNTWGQGNSETAVQVLALAQNPGFVDTNFVGTEVAVATNNQSGTNYNVVSQNTTTQSVLGAATGPQLPGTGENSLYVIVASLMLALGIGTFALGFKLKKRYG